MAADNDTPGNLAAIIDAARWAPEHIHTRVLRITAPRPEPFPASAIPDNCLFHAAGPGPVLHLDDDCILRPTTCQLVGEVLDHHPTAAIWLPTHFVDEHLNRLDGPRFRDWRIDLAESWPPFLPDQRFKLIPGRPGIPDWRRLGLHTRPILAHRRPRPEDRRLPQPRHNPRQQTHDTSDPEPPAGRPAQIPTAHRSRPGTSYTHTIRAPKTDATQTTRRHQSPTAGSPTSTPPGSPTPTK